VWAKEQIEVGFRNAEFGRRGEKYEQGGRIEVAKLGRWEAEAMEGGKRKNKAKSRA